MSSTQQAANALRKAAASAPASAAARPRPEIRASADSPPNQATPVAPRVLPSAPNSLPHEARKGHRFRGSRGGRRRGKGNNAAALSPTQPTAQPSTAALLKQYRLLARGLVRDVLAPLRDLFVQAAVPPASAAAYRAAPAVQRAAPQPRCDRPGPAARSMSVGSVASLSCPSDVDSTSMSIVPDLPPTNLRSQQQQQQQQQAGEGSLQGVARKGQPPPTPPDSVAVHKGPQSQRTFTSSSSTSATRVPASALQQQLMPFAGVASAVGALSAAQAAQYWGSCHARGAYIKRHSRKGLLDVAIRRGISDGTRPLTEAEEAALEAQLDAENSDASDGGG